MLKNLDVRIATVALALLPLTSACKGDKAAKKEQPNAAETTPSKAPKAAQADLSTSVAQAHLPAGCHAVFSLDLKKAQSDPLVKKHLKFPTRDELKALKKTPDADELAAAQAMDALGVTSAKQLHSFAACIKGVDEATGEPKSYAIAVGGEFKKVDDLLKVAQLNAGKTDGKRSKVKIGKIDAVKNEKEELYFAQAKDGALVLSNDQKLLQETYTPSEEYKKYGLAAEHHVSLLVTAELARTLSAAGGGGSPLAQMKPGDIEFHGSLSGKLDGTIGMDSAAEATQAVAMLGMMKSQFARHPDPSVKKSLLATSLKAEGSKLLIHVELPEEVAIDMLESYSKSMMETHEAAQ